MSVTDRDPEIPVIGLDQPPNHVKRLRAHKERGAALFDARCKLYSDRINNQCKVIEELAAMICTVFTQLTIAESLRC